MPTLSRISDTGSVHTVNCADSNETRKAQEQCARCGGLPGTPSSVLSVPENSPPNQNSPTPVTSVDLTTAILKLNTALAAAQEALEAQERMADELSGTVPNRRDTVVRPQRGERVTTAASAQQTLQRLTPREREILTLVASGNSNRKVAKALGIAEKTVKNHLYAIFLKVGASDRTEAVVLGIRGGVLAIDDVPHELPSQAQLGSPGTAV